jgi:transcription initiation factor IIE alpha subunit
MKKLKDVKTDEFHLEVYQCEDCGFRIGLDATYLEQVDILLVQCPACNERFWIGEDNETK